MRISGSWHLQAGTEFIGPDLNRNELPVIRFERGMVTVPDGSHPPFYRDASLGYARLIFDYRDSGEWVRIVIDGGNADTLSGTRHVSAEPLPRLPIDPIGAGLVKRSEPVLFLRPEYIDRIEQERADLAAGVGPVAELLAQAEPQGATLLAVFAHAVPEPVGGAIH